VAETPEADMLVIALALVLLAAACAVVLTEASRSVIPPMAPVVRETGPEISPQICPEISQVAMPLTGTVTGTIPMQRVAGQIGSARADASRARTYAFIAELPAEQSPTVDKSL